MVDDRETDGVTGLLGPSGRPGLARYVADPLACVAAEPSSLKETMLLFFVNDIWKRRRVKVLCEFEPVESKLFVSL